MGIENFGDRLKKFRQQKGLTQLDLARTLKISQGYISSVERNQKAPGKELLIALKRYYNLNINWLLTGEGEMFESPPIKNLIPVRVIPVLGRVPAGIPDIVEENVIEYIRCPEAPENSYAVIAKGESMAPTIRDGDYIIFTFGGNIVSGDIIIVNNEWGETMLKRYREKEGKVFLTSDNPEYPTITPNEHYKIIGKVVAVWRRIKI